MWEFLFIFLLIVIYLGYLIVFCFPVFPKEIERKLDKEDKDDVPLDVLLEIELSNPEHIKELFDIKDKVYNPRNRRI